MVRLSARAAQREVHRPEISQIGHRRRPGQASRMHNKKATRMKPPTILVANVQPPRSIGAPTAAQRTRVGPPAVSPTVIKKAPVPGPTGGGRMGATARLLGQLLKAGA